MSKYECDERIRVILFHYNGGESRSVADTVIIASPLCLSQGYWAASSRW